MRLTVQTATKKASTLQETPAIVSIITQLDIKNWGYRSVGESLAQVPGLYGIFDYTGFNYGIRGINGGQRAYSRIMKVMIDGVAIPFRADSTNFFGPELIPMNLVERIEVVRGPASALYGENAFLGVVNVITKSTKQLPTEVSVAVGDYDYTSIETSTASDLGDWRYKVGLHKTYSEYDGLQLPLSSPNYGFYEDKVSQNSEFSPLSLYSNLSFGSGEYQHSITGIYSHLKSKSEFLDFGTLSHENKISLINWNLSYKLDWQFNEQSELKMKAAYTNGKPGSDERLSLNLENSYPKREFNSQTLELMTEYHYQTSAESSYILGLDITSDRESLIEIFSVDSSSGEVTRLTPDSTSSTLENIGIYLQYTRPFGEKRRVTLNYRNDNHNIYGNHHNYRLGLVQKFSPSFSAKLLYGTSYKAPAAMQLYAQPLYPGEVIGNSELKAEEGKTVETELTWRVSQQQVLILDIWANEITDKVELLPNGPNIQPQNSGRQEGSGLEVEYRWIRAPHSLAINSAFQNMKNKTNLLFQPVEVLPTNLYPKLTAHLKYRYQIGPATSAGFSVQYASERRASNQNIRENFFVPYSLESYTLLNFSFLKKWNNFSINLNLNNVLNESYDEPGFGGIDVPGMSRNWYLKFGYEL
ncbi:TonB-dependent siderophore receptor [Aliikangiella sp. G2MR2-5]|uniref:TonB-dependent receptor plug domain-containing protein n=1 Tax=Aliikangiella sp. G2MR2-5 TaxID=2788943 RepID=UPI0018A96913|nr:TonB-dependent receptor [Aliikangiella sp. G2MR2-5]